MGDPYAQCYHPSGFIADELVARKWTPDMLIDAMMQHYSEDRTKLELMVSMYFEVGPTTKSLRLGERLIDLLHRVFGTSREVWAGIEKSWLDDPSQPFQRP